jgi:hypothetical protein
MSDEPLTGGCQCGAVRFAVEDGLGRASLCHCRMCQKANGAFYGPFVTAYGVRWTRGAPKYFQSSNLVRRGFCGDCGTPLTFEAGADVELTIGAFDKPSQIVPAIAVGLESKLPWVDDLDRLPTRSPGEAAEAAARHAAIRSYQHPDHDTDAWPPAEAGYGTAR